MTVYDRLRSLSLIFSSLLKRFLRVGVKLSRDLGVIHPVEFKAADLSLPLYNEMTILDLETFLPEVIPSWG